MADEIAVYQDDSIYITNLRVIIHRKTFAMSHVTSVVAHTIPANKLPGIVTMIIGVVMALGGFAGRDAGCGFAVLGVILIVVGIIYVQRAKDVYTVRIASSSGETSALRSDNDEYIARIRQAMNDAIIARG